MATITTGNGAAKAKKQKPEPRPKTPREPKQPKATAQKTPPAPVWASPVKPSLILLPPKARGLKARRRAVRQSLFMSLGLLGLTAAGYLVVLAGTAGAQAELDKEKAITARASASLEENRDVQTYAEGFIQRKAAAGTALDEDVAYSRVVEAIQGANSVGAVFTSLKTAAPDSQCMSSSPFAPSTSLGCLDVSGKAPSIEAVAHLVAALNKDKDMLSEPYLKESTVVDDGVSFKITIGHTEKALSLKGDKFKPSPEELASIESPTATEQVSPAQATQGASQ